MPFRAQEVNKSDGCYQSDKFDRLERIDRRYCPQSLLPCSDADASGEVDFRELT